MTPPIPPLRRRAFLALTGAAAVAACGPRGSLTFVEGPLPPGGRAHTILVATTRERIEVQPLFTRRRADPPIFAEFEVWVPPDRVPGSVVFPETQPPDLATDFVTLSGRTLRGEAAFVREIDAIRARHMREPGYSDRATIFVHGYNTSFAEGLYRHAQLLQDYGNRAVPVHFAWPSAASAKGYIFDRESALFSRDALETTLLAMARSDVREINVIGHSMGCFLVMETLRTMGRIGAQQFFDKLNAVLLVSPDIEIDVFRKQAPPVLARGAPIFVVVSTRDRALRMSTLIRAEGAPRVGAIASPEELGDLDVTVIDLSQVDAGGGMGHFALARSPDLIELLNGMRASGIEMLDVETKRGPLSAGVSLVQHGADFLLSPLAPRMP